MRKPLIAGNWKMNTNLSEATSLVQTMLPELDRIAGVEKVLCPPFISLVAVRELIKGTSVELGAQNMFSEDNGAYTGEVSPLMLIDLCEFVILGHSERRQYFAETDELVNKKVQKALDFGLTPILCVGERLEDNEAGRTEKIIKGQVQAALAGVNSTSHLVIAYEPIWAIGTGRAANGKQANATISLVRNTVASLWDSKSAQAIRIVYGGSVTGENIAEFIAEPEIDGALVGGASLKANEFVSIVSQTASLKST
ncbi:MAG: triose-phosphate isomerase [Dehalococcoidia bacterium]|nr:MAG: triose-phosphate isomerase [Dehalococcoidia bacterium]